MKSLIIHPNDPSTDFLDITYKDIPNKTVITGGISKNEIPELIQSHDRVIMLGHGCPVGLFSVNQFKDSWNGLIIDKNTVKYLQEKENNVFIWCNADRFVNHYKLKGFFTGMFISEVGEANYCRVYGTDQELIDESNFGFCNILSKHINESQEVIHERVKEEYKMIAEENPVALYNYNRLYLNQ